MKNLCMAMGLLLLVSFSQCTQKETPTTHVQPIYVRAATYQPGSYYVFRDSVTHGLDSFYVTLCDTSVYTPPNERIETVESVFKNNANGKFNFYANGASSFLLFNYEGINTLSFSDFIYGINLRVGYKINDAYVSNSCLNRYDTLVINNHEYYNVYETLYQKYVNTDTTYLHKWYNLQDGLIKLRIHGNGVDKVYTTLRHLQLN